ncbi:hypothetical protein J8I26_04675 [Herbaspirillum sp. LeCh32-8]|uniref:hypothetical protein n=1 Tax=Herbaspirillum sp. LeCh32-8 TaxID=2821356 RepID=UPI001AE78CE9|nr:hypothetical protein [Herbaspirillum sp. LeCh32-8]MBP0597386.1 hypothetical protein [Herbaspirillum sp. LeCh32-8]
MAKVEFTNSTGKVRHPGDGMAMNGYVETLIYFGLFVLALSLVALSVRKRDKDDD